MKNRHLLALKPSIITILFSTMLLSGVFAQKKKTQFQRIEPPFWWTGMKSTSLELLFYNNTADISGYTASINYQGVSLKENAKVSNPHYLFLTLEITSDAPAGMIPIQFTYGKKKFTINYELKTRDKSVDRIQGFNSSDVIYLIMPDRFANGDTKNDTLPAFMEGTHREKPEGRHGGDIKGISDHLDYIKDLGVTSIWLNPVLENNQPYSSYHGYAITDLYKVDGRFGSNEDYVVFIKKSQGMGLKIIQDMVMNHIGHHHWLVQDLPEKNWIHQFPQFTRSNYQGTVVSDPYQSDYDANLISNGWFDTSMPDVNQKDPRFARYLIQNTLWWIEYAGIDGIRMDTYPYPDKDFMAEWVSAVMEEYPMFNIVGEVWFDNIANTAYWQKGSLNKDGYKSTLPSVTDFPLCLSIPKSLNEKTGWDTGMRRIYNVLCQDFVYPDPFQNLIFLDNHDMSRIFLSLQKDVKKLKLALAFLLTTRGIPQLYYGTELLMDGDGGYHPNVRKDFPGGWSGDKVNAFDPGGRTAGQHEVFNYLQNLLQWRKTAEVIHRGDLTHYVPEDNVYIYFRYNSSKTVMVLLNANQEEKTIDTKRFSQNMRSFRKGQDVLAKREYADIQSVSVPGLTALILELE